MLNYHDGMEVDGPLSDGSLLGKNKACGLKTGEALSSTSSRRAMITKS